VKLLRIALLGLVPAFCFAQRASTSADATLSQRSFAEPASTVQAALNKLQPTLSGSLPTLDGFVKAGAQSFDHYQRPYYHCSVRVTSTAAGASLVSVTAKITALHDVPPHAGYEILESNGRLESDLLDRLQDSLGSQAHAEVKAEPAPDISAPMPQLPKHSGSVSTSDTARQQDSPLDEEARGLAEILRNQSHPTNLVAIKRDQTPILEAPSADAKVLFMASAEDEFEILDVNPQWVHVRMSGLSRGWLRRSGVEVLDGSLAAQNEQPQIQEAVKPVAASASAPFSVSSEEVGLFPGTWGPLKGKNAKIISVQQASGTGRMTSPQDKLRFAGSVFSKEVLPAGADGLVLIFDAEDGGMIASTREDLEQWRHGSISEGKFWKKCLLDPPEILGASN
jgi:hypothetical protein